MATRQEASKQRGTHTTTQEDDRSRSSQQQQQQQPQQQQQSQSALSQRQQAPPELFISPFSLMRRFGEGMEQLLAEFGGAGMRSRGMNEMAAWTPQIEMFERDGQLVIRADLPGLKKDDVRVELRDDAVVIRGERQEERREEREGFYRTERSYGVFYREIPLPAGVDTDRATANFRDGVLEIAMPVEQGEARGRQLQIQDSAPAEQGRPRAQAAGAGR